jgi:hypothetical protein
MNVNNLIKKSLEYYDKQQTKYKYYWYKSDLIVENKENKITIIDSEDENNIKLKSTYEILGIFDNQTKVWIWAWLLPFLNLSETTISRKLLEYGLKLEPNSNTHDHLYIKSQLLNSRILIEDSIELDIHLALVSYLVKELYLFVMPLRTYYNDEKTKYSTIYYLIK